MDVKERSLRNVMLLAVRAKNQGWRPEDVDALLRFCAEAGVTPSILREGEAERQIPPHGYIAALDSTDAGQSMACYYLGCDRAPEDSVHSG